MSKLPSLCLYVSGHRPPSDHVFLNMRSINRLEAGVHIQCSTVGSMKLQIEQREREKIVILDLKGRLVLGDEDFSLLQRLLLLMESRRCKIVLNFKDVSNIDETGLDTIAFCAMRFQDAGGRLVLLNFAQSHPRNPTSLNHILISTAINKKQTPSTAFSPTVLFRAMTSSNS